MIAAPGPGGRSGWLFLVVLAILAGQASAVYAQDPAAAALRGRVVNGTAGGLGVSGALVSIYSGTDTNRLLAGSAETNGEGSFSVASLSSRPAERYTASVNYEGVTYTKAAADVGVGADEDPNITVYETTESEEVVSVERMSLVLAGLDTKRGFITLVESYHFLNSSLNTYVGRASAGQRVSLRFPLFAGARSLVALDGFRLDDATAAAQGFAISSPVPPGRTAISFTYDIPLRGGAVTLGRPLTYATSLEEVILPGGIGVSSLQLGEQGSVQLGGRSFDTIQGGALAAGTLVEITLTGLPAPAHGIKWESLPVQGAILLAIVGSVGATVYVQRRRLSRLPRGKLRRERERLLLLVADLDAHALRGNVDAAIYAVRRQEAMERLACLTQQLWEGYQEGASGGEVRAAEEIRTRSGEV